MFNLHSKLCIIESCATALLAVANTMLPEREDNGIKKAGTNDLH